MLKGFDLTWWVGKSDIRLELRQLDAKWCDDVGMYTESDIHYWPACFPACLLVCLFACLQYCWNGGVSNSGPMCSHRDAFPDVYYVLADQHSTEKCYTNAPTWLFSQVLGKWCDLFFWLLTIFQSFSFLEFPVKSVTSVVVKGSLHLAGATLLSFLSSISSSSSSYKYCCIVALSLITSILNVSCWRTQMIC